MWRIRFVNPAKSRIAILHGDGYWLKRSVLPDLSTTTLALYPTEIHLTPQVIARTLWRLRHLARPFAGARALAAQAYRQYVLACLDQVGADIVMTTIDNSGLFQRLSRIDTGRTYFAIQNGTRTLACVKDSLPVPPHPGAVISMPWFFCFGERDIDLFGRHGHRIDHYVPVGSLLGGYYRSTMSPGDGPVRFDVCLVSQWHCEFFGGVGGNDFAADTRRRMATAVSGLNALLVGLAARMGLTVVVCLRGDDARESAFYRAAFGEAAVLIAGDRRAFSTYRTVEQSRLTVGVNSTTLAEVFSWGRKVLWCNITGHEHYEMSEAGLAYFEGTDPEAFEARARMLLDMPEDEYQQRTRTAADRINHFDCADPPHEKIRSIVLQALAHPN